MDENVLAKKGIRSTGVFPGFVDGWGLRIGERATLVGRPGDRAYGVVMDITPVEAAELYAEESVSDYLPESVIVERQDGTRVEATCFVLPGDTVTGTNRKYAASLLEVATRLNFPGSYLDRIRRALT